MAAVQVGECLGVSAGISGCGGSTGLVVCRCVYGTEVCRWAKFGVGGS